MSTNILEKLDLYGSKFADSASVTVNPIMAEKVRMYVVLYDANLNTVARQYIGENYVNTENGHWVSVPVPQTIIPVPYTQQYHATNSPSGWMQPKINKAMIECYPVNGKDVSAIMPIYEAGGYSGHWHTQGETKGEYWVGLPQIAQLKEPAPF
jgi:hypothetical protein